MIPYPSDTAFRQAPEQRLINQARAEPQVPLVRLRKAVAFEALLRRLLRDHPDEWLVKGGFALQLRLGLQTVGSQDTRTSLNAHTHATLLALNNQESLSRRYAYRACIRHRTVRSKQATASFTPSSRCGTQRGESAPARALQASGVFGHPCAGVVEEGRCCTHPCHQGTNLKRGHGGSLLGRYLFLPTTRFSRGIWIRINSSALAGKRDKSQTYFDHMRLMR